MVFPTFAYPLLAFEEVICTSVKNGLISNSVKCSVSKLHICCIPDSSLPVHEKLLMIDVLGIIDHVVLFTTILSVFIGPLSNIALSKYMVNVAGIFLNALHEAVEVSYAMKLICPLFIIRLFIIFVKNSCVPVFLKSMPVNISILPILGTSIKIPVKFVTLSLFTSLKLFSMPDNMFLLPI